MGEPALREGPGEGGGEKTETLEAEPPGGASHKSEAAEEDCKMRQRSVVSGLSKMDVTGDLGKRRVGAGRWTMHLISTGLSPVYMEEGTKIDGT